MTNCSFTTRKGKVAFRTAPGKCHAKKKAPAKKAAPAKKKAAPAKKAAAPPPRTGGAAQSAPPGPYAPSNIALHTK